MMVVISSGVVCVGLETGGALLSLAFLPPGSGKRTPENGDGQPALDFEDFIKISSRIYPAPRSLDF